MRGFFGIGIYNPRFDVNIGTLWRHANLYNASFLFVIGRRFKKSRQDTTHSHKHIPCYEYKTYEEFKANLPIDTKLVAIEMHPQSTPLSDFKHPERTIYLLGAEDTGLPQGILEDMDGIISIESYKPNSMNVATAGTLVLYDRTITKKKNKR